MVLQERIGIFEVSFQLFTLTLSHRQKRAKIIKKQIAKGIRDADQDDPFELFVSSTSIRYTYYKETEKILGNTFGMCVLQVSFIVYLC